MSRSGYEDIDDNWRLIRWRGAAAAAVKGKRGQKFLRELAGYLDAMPEKQLIAYAMEKDGHYCTLGVVGKARGIVLGEDQEFEAVGEAFDISGTLAAEIMDKNDDGGPYCESPECRWTRMRAWVQDNLKEG